MKEFQEQDAWGSLNPIPISEPSVPIKIRKNIKSALSAEFLRSSSVPVYVPDWNKVQKEEPPKKKWCDESEKEDMNACNGEGDDGGEDDKGEWLPPHEILARRMKGSNRAAYSMCEGKGRTLKGRDLINVRNAVFVRTGFLKREDLVKTER